MNSSPKAVGGAFAWSAQDVRDRAAWLVDVGAPVDGNDRDGLLRGGVAARAIRAARDSLARGPGFAVVRGLTLHQVEIEAATRAYFAICSEFGNVRDPASGTTAAPRLAARAEAPRSIGGYVSGSRTSGAIRMHTEHGRMQAPPGAISLLCYRASGEGGESLLASGVRAHDLMLAEAPELARRLYEGAPLARHPDFDPDPTHYDVDSVFSVIDRNLRVRYPRYWLRRAMDIGIGPIDGDLQDACDLLDGLLERADVFVEIALEPGDVLFINNTRILHGRSAFRDTDGSGGRMLLRALID